MNSDVRKKLRLLDCRFLFGVLVCAYPVVLRGLGYVLTLLGIGPLFLSPLSEFFGRRIIYIVSFSLFLIWLIPCAVAKNTETMIIARFLSGLSGSAFLSVAGGTVGDMFDRHELALPMMLYTASPFVGPEVGPLYEILISLGAEHPPIATLTLNH